MGSWKKQIPIHNNVRGDPVAAAILDKYMGKDGTMTNKQINAFGKAYRAKLITPEEEAMWKRGASNTTTSAARRPSR